MMFRDSMRGLSVKQQNILTSKPSKRNQGKAATGEKGRISIFVRVRRDGNEDELMHNVDLQKEKF
jgi:hypothetical protein